MERSRQKLVGRDKGSLTEQQTEGTVTTTIQIRRKYDTTQTRTTDPFSWTGPALRAPEPRVSPRCAFLTYNKTKFMVISRAFKREIKSTLAIPGGAALHFF